MAKVATTGLTVSGVPYGESVAAGELVGWSASKLVRAFGGVSGPVPAVGVAAATYKNGDVGAMHLICQVAGFSGLVVGAAQYLSVTAAGGVQSSEPVGAGELKQVVGYAVAADRVMVVLQDAGVLV